MSSAPSLLRMSGEPLIGRVRERVVLDRLVDGARVGNGGVLVVSGEPGVGKTALLGSTVDAAHGFQIAFTRGVEGEMELPFSAAKQLCSNFAGFMGRLPQPQVAALRIAFGLDEGSPPNPFLVGLAVLGLLSEAAEQQPLLAIVDDAQWLDRASGQALAFVARRLLAERIALVFAVREMGETFVQLPSLEIGPLGRRDARSLLKSVLRVPIEEGVLERLVHESGGNPLALIELPRSLTATQLAGGFGLPALVPLAEGIEESFRRRLAGLPHDARRLLVLAAAEPVGDLSLLWRAAVLLGIPATAAEAVESAGLLTFGAQVAFRHPLVRSSVYDASGLKERREIHRALGEATDPQVDPDRRAWHFAQACDGPDEGIASELERSASRAESRGGLAAAAAFLERAAALSPDSFRRAQRALAAAQVMFEAGALEEALALLDDAGSAAVVGAEVGARVGLLRAQIAFVSRRGNDAPALLVVAAQELERLEPSLARATYLDALSASTLAGRLAVGAGIAEVSEAALGGPPMPEAPAPSDLLLQGTAVRFTKGYAAGAPLLKAALSAFRREADLPAREARWLWFATWTALEMWDDAAWMVLSTRQLELARQAGALSTLPFVLPNRSSVLAFLGDLDKAVALEVELSAVTDATGIAPVRYGALALAAVRGREAEFSELYRTTVAEAQARGEGLILSVAEFLGGGLYNGLGRFETALALVSPAERICGEGPALWALTELIEAAVRTGDRERARRACERLSETARPAGTDWGLGIEARSYALVSEGAEADALYREAIRRLGRTTIRVQLARTHLLYGEWLRRERRRLDAREQLQTAYKMFCDFGAEAFAERARVELNATGGHARKPTVETLPQLTRQEAEIARLAAEGHTNREIATRLFISPSTVNNHLRKVFQKLEVRSRTQLARRLSG